MQLADLFNLSFVTGVFPSILKTAKVVLVFNKDSKLDYSDYRPISLLSNIEEILEKLMYKRLYTFLNNNNIIYNLQFSFRQHNLTSHALIHVTENIRKAFDEGNIDCRVFVDVQKAFDIVDHQILLAKLDHYGIRGVSNDWFKSYLSNHNQYVSIYSYDSGLTANGNKISLNVKKTEMVIFKSKQKKFEGDLKIRLCGKRLYLSESVKCL